MNQTPDYIIDDISIFEKRLKELQMHIRLAEEANLNSETESAKEEKKNVETILLCLRSGYPLIYIDDFLSATDACGLRYLKFPVPDQLSKTIMPHIFEKFEIYCLFEESEDMEHVEKLWKRIIARRKGKLHTKELEELLFELREKAKTEFTDYYLIGSVGGNNFLIALHQ